MSCQRFAFSLRKNEFGLYIWNLNKSCLCAGFEIGKWKKESQKSKHKSRDTDSEQQSANVEYHKERAV